MRGPGEDEAGRVARNGLADLERRRGEVLEILAELEEHARERGEAAGAELVREACERLLSGRFTIAVFGEFKRGKSTLVNALLGTKVMPVGVTPLTSLAVRVEHGAEPACEVRFEDGRERTATVDRLEDYATERGNPGNVKGVRDVRVLHPAPVLAQGAILVDTPGVGSIHRGSTREANEYLPHADAAVFVLGVDAPAAQDEIDFLRRVGSEADRVFVVLNKADLLAADELEEARAFVSEALAGAGLDYEVFALSARRADAGFQAFRSALESFVADEQAGYPLYRARGQAAAAIRQELLAAEVERRSLTLSARELEERAGALRERLAEVRRRRDELGDHLGADVRRLVADVLDPSIGAFRREGAASVRAAVEAEAAAGGRDLARRLQASADSELRRLVADRSARLERELGGCMAGIAGRYVEETSRLAGEVARLAAGLFEVAVPDVDVPAELNSPSRFSFRLDDQAMILEIVASGLRRLAPGPLGRALTRREARRRAEEMVDRHAGRLRHDLSQRVDGHRRALVAHLRAAVDAALFSVTGAVDAAVAARARGMDAAVQAMTGVGAREGRLRSLQDRLDRT